MLSHHAYFSALGKIGNTADAEWHETVAGLVTLRLVDDWLSCAQPNNGPDETQVTAVRHLLTRVPKVRPVKPILERIIRAIENVRHNSVRTVAPHVISYSHHLTDGAQYALAHDALLPLHEHALKAKDSKLIIKTALRLARILRRRSMYEAAIERYEVAIYHAHQIRDIKSQLMAKTGLSKVIAVRGDLSKAFALCADVAIEAEATRDFSALGTAFHDQGFAAYLAGESRTALTYCTKAMRYLRGVHRECLLADLASISSKMGDFSAATKIDAELSVTATMQATRYQAGLNLMHIATNEGNFSAFDLWRQGLQLASMEPWTRMWYWRLVADGHRRFGDTLATEQALRSAYAIAAEHDIDPTCLG